MRIEILSDSSVTIVHGELKLFVDTRSERQDNETAIVLKAKHPGEPAISIGVIRTSDTDGTLQLFKE